MRGQLAQDRTMETSLLRTDVRPHSSVTSSLCLRCGCLRFPLVASQFTVIAACSNPIQTLLRAQGPKRLRQQIRMAQTPIPANRNTAKADASWRRTRWPWRGSRSGSSSSGASERSETIWNTECCCIAKQSAESAGSRGGVANNGHNMPAMVRFYNRVGEVGCVSDFADSGRP